MKGSRMIDGPGKHLKFLPFIITIFVFISNCSHAILRLESNGEPQTEYTYQLPEKVTDGWEISSLEKEGIDPVKIHELMLAILNQKYKNIHSVLLVKNGKLILEEYFHGYHREKRHQTRSAMKSIGSVLTGIAIDRGFISSEDEKIYPYFKSYEPEEKWDTRVRDVTLKSLLTMTSGYGCDDVQSKYACERNMYKSTDHVEYALNLPMAHNPGEQWAYNSASLWLVGEIISKESDMSIPDFAERYLFGPLGITDVQWWNSPKGRAMLAGNAEMRPRDMAKFGHMVLNSGKWKGTQIVSKEWIEKSTRAHVRNSGGYWGYGYLWWVGGTVINGREVNMYLASGNGGQKIYIFPEFELVAVFTGGNYNSKLSSQPDQMLINYILPAMMPSSPPMRFVDPEQHILKQCSGQYLHGPSRTKVNIAVENNGLMLYEPKLFGSEKIELMPLADNKFYGTSKDKGDLYFTFVKGEKDPVTHFFVRGGFGFTRIQFDRTENLSQK
jgi:CubicO group peptidase (beta-lactamase class C family)